MSILERLEYTDKQKAESKNMEKGVFRNTNWVMNGWMKEGKK